MIHTLYLCVIKKVFNNYPWSTNEAEGQMGYGVIAHEGERDNCFSKIQLVVLLELIYLIMSLRTYDTQIQKSAQQKREI